MPTLIEGGKRVAALAERFAAWAKANPATLQSIMKITAAVAAFLAVAALVAGVVAVLANIPVVIGVAIAAAAAAIYTHWDELKAFFSDPASWTWINTVMSNIARSMADKIFAILEAPFVALGIMEKGKWSDRAGRERFLMGKYADPANRPRGLSMGESAPAPTTGGRTAPTQFVKGAQATRAAFATAAGLPEVLGGTRPTPKAAASRTTTVNYAPVVTIKGGDETTKAGFLQELQKHKYELGQMFKGLQQDEARVSF
jgi:hypothetical protein